MAGSPGALSHLSMLARPGIYNVNADLDGFLGVEIRPIPQDDVTGLCPSRRVQEYGAAGAA